MQGDSSQNRKAMGFKVRKRPGSSGSQLAAQEAEIRRIAVQSQPRKIVLRDPFLKKTFIKKGWQSGSRCRP
jgi:hypothetical protein